MSHIQSGEDLMDLIETGRTKMGNILTCLPASKNSSSGASHERSLFVVSEQLGRYNARRCLCLEFLQEEGGERKKNRL